MNNQVVFNKFAVKSGDNWVADSDLLKRTAGYKVTAEDWNSIFLILASQADNNASAVKELADSASSQSDTITAHSESISNLNAKVQTLETENERAVWEIKVGNNILSASDNAMSFPVDVDTMQSPDHLPTVRAVKDYVEHFAMDSAGFVIDAELSDTSEHALQNKKVKEAVDNLQSQITSNLTSIVENSKVVTNKFTEVDSAISSVSATAMTNLDRAEERINQNILHLQNALGAEITNRESAVFSLGNSVSENTDKINGILTTISGKGGYSMIDGAISLVKRSNIVLVSANFTKAQAMTFFTRDAAGDGVVVPDKYKPYYNDAYFPIVYNLAGNKIGYGTIQYNTGRIKLFFESGANINNINGIAFSVAYPSLN